jgi:hypothetical protein
VGPDVGKRGLPEHGCHRTFGGGFSKPPVPAGRSQGWSAAAPFFIAVLQRVEALFAGRQGTYPSRLPGSGTMR